MSQILKSARIEIVISTVLEGLNTMSRKSAIAVSNALFDHCENVSIVNIDSLEDLQDLALRAPDLVFLGIKYLPLHPELGMWDVEKIWVADFLAEHRIAYTGSNGNAHRLEEDKALAKQTVLAYGLNTSPFHIIEKDATNFAHKFQLSYPLFVKPTNRGGGIGIDASSVVHNLSQLNNKVNHLSQNLEVDSLVEEYLTGNEYSVAILQSTLTNKLEAYPLQIVAPKDANGDSILSQGVKTSDTEKVFVLEASPFKEKICDLAINVFKAIGGSGYGRIDLRCRENNQANFLEANLIPSLLENYGSFPKALKLNAGIEYKSMIIQIATLGIQNSIAKKSESLIA